MPGFLIPQDDELKLRELANEIAKDVEDIPDILKRLGFSDEDYVELCETRMFRAMLTQAFQEWGGAGATPKRVKLKAAVNIENGLPDMFAAMVDKGQPLSSRVKVFEVMARIGGLGNPEPAMSDNGQSFNLTIHLDGGRREEIVISNISASSTTHEETAQFSEAPDRIPTSARFAGQPIEPL